MNKYVKSTDMKSFAKNMDILVDVLNHRMTSVEKSLRLSVEHVAKMSTDMAEIKGIMKVTSKIVWWILGIIGFIVGSAFLSMIINP